jgi:hypothetical protein
MRVENANTFRHVTVYAGKAQQAAIARRVLDEHVVSAATGRCLKCDVPGPCLRRLTALECISFRRSCRCRAGYRGGSSRNG